MRKKQIVQALLAISILTSMTAFKTNAAPTMIPNGSVVIGNKAFDLSYANDPKNADEITTAIVASGDVYVKSFDGSWIENATLKNVNSSIIPAVTYKDGSGQETNFAAGDKYEDPAEELDVISIE